MRDSHAQSTRIEMLVPDQPLVTVIINCFNGEKYLRDAIESVLAQTYNNWEIVFWDNQSSDNSADIAKSYSDSRIKYYYAPLHTVLYEARNYALKHANGEFVAFLDVDDLWLPEKLERQILLFDNPEIGMACTNYYIDDHTKTNRAVAYKRPIPTGRVLDNLLKHYYVGLLTLMVRRSLLNNSTQAFDPRYHIIGDYDLTIRLAAKWKLDCVQEPMAVYRIHGSNESAKHAELTVIEHEIWHSEYSKDPIIGQSVNFHWVATQIKYLYGLNALRNQGRVKAYSFFLSMPWCRLKLKLLIRLLLQFAMFKRPNS